MSWFSNFYGRVQNPLLVARDPFDNAVIKAGVASLGKEFWFRTKRAERVKSALRHGLPEDREDWGKFLGGSLGAMAGLYGSAIPINHMESRTKALAVLAGSILLGTGIGSFLGGNHGRVKDIKDMLKQKSAASAKVKTPKEKPAPTQTPNPNSYGAMRKKMLSEL